MDPIVIQPPQACKRSEVKLSQIGSDIDLPGTVDACSRFHSGFFPMGDPTRDTSQSKHYRKHISWNANCPVDNTTVKIYIGVEFTFDKIAVMKCDFFQFFGNIDEGIINPKFIQNLIH